MAAPSHTRNGLPSIFIHAIATGFASDNPGPTLSALLKPHGLPINRSLFSITEALGILAVLDRVDTKLAFALACFNGMRKGEIRGLRW